MYWKHFRKDTQAFGFNFSASKVDLKSPEKISTKNVRSEVLEGKLLTNLNSLSKLGFFRILEDDDNYPRRNRLGWASSTLIGHYVYLEIEINLTNFKMSPISLTELYFINLSTINVVRTSKLSLHILLTRFPYCGGVSNCLRRLAQPR